MLNSGYPCNYFSSLNTNKTRHPHPYIKYHKMLNIGLPIAELKKNIYIYILKLTNNKKQTKMKDLKVKVGTEVHVVSLLSDASKIVRNFITRKDIGATKYYQFKNCGYVFEDGKPIAHISYNGRIWEYNGTQIGNEIINQTHEHNR